MGGDGNDRILTGAGPDVAYGGAGDDLIIDDFTGGGTENLYGGSGNDTIRALTGGDLGPFPEDTNWWMFGQAGDDRLVGGVGGTSHLYGGSGRDVLIMSAYGGGEAYGGSGNDKLMSESSQRINEEIDTDAADKYGPGAQVTLHGGTGNDRLFGYSGNADIFVFRPGDGRDIVHNFGTGEWGIDRIDLSAYGFDMSAEDVFATYGHERKNGIILNFGPDSKVVILDTPYNGGTDVSAQDVIDALLL
jgi:Ca2+-binding RTX toxin-like protein